MTADHSPSPSNRGVPEQLAEALQSLLSHPGARVRIEIELTGGSTVSGARSEGTDAQPTGLSAIPPGVATLGFSTKGPARLGASTTRDPLAGVSDDEVRPLDEWARYCRESERLLRRAVAVGALASAPKGHGKDHKARHVRAGDLRAHLHFLEQVRAGLVDPPAWYGRRIGRDAA